MWFCYDVELVLLRHNHPFLSVEFIFRYLIFGRQCSFKLINFLFGVRQHLFERHDVTHRILFACRQLLIKHLYLLLSFAGNNILDDLLDSEGYKWSCGGTACECPQDGIGENMFFYTFKPTDQTIHNCYYNRSIVMEIIINEGNPIGIVGCPTVGSKDTHRQPSQPAFCVFWRALSLFQNTKCHAYVCHRL